VAFRRHAALLQAASATPGQGSIALDGNTLRGSFDKFNDRAAAQVLSAFAIDTSLVLAHIDIAEKSNEIPAAQALLDHGKDSVRAFTQALPVRVSVDRMGVLAVRTAMPRVVC